MLLHFITAPREKRQPGAVMTNYDSLELTRLELTTWLSNPAEAQTEKAAPPRPNTNLPLPVA